MHELSVVIPAFNERDRLPATLGAISAHRSGASTEIIVVDDGSTDDTAAVAASLGVRVIMLGTHAGAGAAVRRGMLAAHGARILMCDADGPVPLDDLAILWTALDDGYDVAAGSRTLRPELVEQRQPWHRILMGRTWTKLVQAVLPTPVMDTQCGFKLFTRHAARALFSRCRSNSFAFHAEALAMAPELGFSVIELPVRWSDNRGSKIRILRESAHMAWELLAASGRFAAFAGMAGAPKSRFHDG